MCLIFGADFPSLWYKNLIDAQVMAQIMDFRKFDLRRTYAVDFPFGYQIWYNNVDRRQNYGQKSKLQMAAVRHLGFF